MEQNNISTGLGIAAHLTLRLIALDLLTRHSAVTEQQLRDHARVTRRDAARALKSLANDGAVIRDCFKAAPWQPGRGLPIYRLAPGVRA